jgi:hypothetical protein
LIVITGFNTDIEHNGVVYHVQTEDKGLDSPLILSLVYVGGAILASKRTHYHDLISSGFDENILAERLQRQHKLICAAIHAGRIEDLKRQTEREASSRAKAPEQPSPPPEEVAPPAQDVSPPPPPPPPPDMEIIRGGSEMYEILQAPNVSPPFEVKADDVIEEPLEVTPMPETETPVRAPNEWERADYSKIIDYASTESRAEGLSLSLIEEKKFVAGEFVKIQVRVGDGPGGRESVQGAKVTLKVLGSSFRPLIFSGATEGEGIATFYAMLPHFKSGRAAILVSATAKGHRAEMRRVIHQAGM